jgi:type VI secretion system protein ImpG
MDPRLLHHYNDELAYLREVGAEFASEFPKIAGRLTLDGLEVADPYVERLLEGVAFLSARVQLKLDAEYPQLQAHLLETLHPNFLAPVPSMMVARMALDLANPALLTGASLPRGSSITSNLARGQATRCEFRTAHALPLWPVTVDDVRYFNHAGDLPLTQVPAGRLVQGGLRIRLRAHGGARFKQLAMDRLPVYIAAPGDTAHRMHELIGAAMLGSVVLSVDAKAAPTHQAWRDATSVQPMGFADDQALLPETLRGFSGYRLVQELAAMPQRFFFFELCDLRERLRHVDSDTVEVVLLFSRGDASLLPLVDAQSLALHCTPAINLFSKRLDRVPTGLHASEYHVVPDRTRPMDFEVHSIDAVVGYSTGEVGVQTFTPLYTTHHSDTVGNAQPQAHYAVRREPRMLSQRQRQQGTRSAYVGTEVFLSLVDTQERAYQEEVRQLSVNAWVTNRDLPTLLPQASSRSATTTPPAGAPDNAAWQVDAAASITGVACIHGPTRPAQRAAMGPLGWQLINQLNLNYLCITGGSDQQAAAALRAILSLHGPHDDPAWRKAVDGIQAVRAQATTRRMPYGGALAFGAGVAVDVDIDELALQGSSAFLLGSVIEQLMARQAAINSFTQTSLRSTTRGMVMRWPPRVGQTPLV